MNRNPFSFNEFIATPKEEYYKEEDFFEEEEVEEESSEELDVQKAVVEELAAEKIELHEQISSRDKEIENLKVEIEKLKSELATKENEVVATKNNFEEIEKKVALLSENLSTRDNREEELKKEISTRDSEISTRDREIESLREKELDSLERNPNSLALLDRDVDLPDRFLGETRDHVLEVIREARDKAEAEGRIRQSQILESVLVANEPYGSLKKRRELVEKLFKENANVINGTVIEELKNLKISHKHGEEYLLPSEILKINF